MTNQGPQPLKPGGWLSGTGEDDRVAAARELLQAGREELSDPNPARFEKLLVGNAARDILAGVVCRPESAAKLLSQLVADCEMNMQLSMDRLIGADDPGTPEARQDHFNARVARAMVNLLRKYVEQGEEAHQQLNHQSEE